MDAPSKKENQALEKATGQNPLPESEKDSKPNIQQLAKEIDVAELIRLSMKNAEKIKTVRSDLDAIYEHKEDLKKRLKEIKILLKPVSRSRKKLHTSQSQPSLTSRERKVLKAERDDIDDQLFSLNEEIAAGEEELSRLTGRSSDYSKEKKLRSKAYGKNYIKRHKNVFKNKMLKALNEFYKTSDSKTKSRIRSLARSNASNALQTFKQEFGNILEAIDVETFIMCSGMLSKELYSAAKLTIRSKGNSFRGPFEELIMPEE